MSATDLAHDDLDDDNDDDNDDNDDHDDDDDETILQNQITDCI